MRCLAHWKELSTTLCTVLILIYLSQIFDVKNSVRVADRILCIHGKVILVSHRYFVILIKSPYPFRIYHFQLGILKRKIKAKQKCLELGPMDFYWVLQSLLLHTILNNAQLCFRPVEQCISKKMSTYSYIILNRCYRRTKGFCALIWH